MDEDVRVGMLCRRARELREELDQVLYLIRRECRDVGLTDDVLAQLVEHQARERERDVRGP